MNEMQRHLGNISRLVGTNANVRYSYAIDNNSIEKAYMQIRDELGYPLQIDSRNRRAIVYNKKGIEKKMQKLVDDCIISEVKLMENMIANDVVNLITYQLNGIPHFDSGSVKSSAMKNFAGAFALGLTNGLINIVDDMMNIEDR